MTKQEALIESAQTLVVGGEQHRRDGNLDVAIEQFSEAILLPLPEGAERNLLLYHAFACRGSAWGQQGDQDAAIDDFSRSISIDPDRALAYYNRGIAWEEKGPFDQAIDDYSRAIALESDHADAYLRRGLTWKKVDQLDRAEADFAAVRHLGSCDEV